MLGCGCYRKMKLKRLIPVVSIFVIGAGSLLFFNTLP